MTRLAVIATRGGIAESTHPVSAVAVDAHGRVVAQAGAPNLVTYWRSASKPYQLQPLVEAGGVERFGLDGEMLALACASHNAEERHRLVGQRWLDAVGLSESDLSCGGHLSLWGALADRMTREHLVLTPLWSNCSGKHAALLALAKLRGWPLSGYNERSHPVQNEVANTVARAANVGAADLVWGVDGCTAAAVALPLEGMARAYAHLGNSSEASIREIREAMLAHPFLIAGTDRLDTVLMEEWAGRVIAKIGAEGVYSAALPSLGLGVALKVHDGDMKSAGVALVEILLQLTSRFGANESWPSDALKQWHRPSIRNTRGEVTGYFESTGVLEMM